VSTIVDDWSTVNGTVWHTTGTLTCAPYGPVWTKTVNSHAFVSGYMLKTNGTGSVIIIPANTGIVFVIHDTMGVDRRLIGTFGVIKA
jgi:hypothetical protein